MVQLSIVFAVHTWGGMQQLHSFSISTRTEGAGQAGLACLLTNDAVDVAVEREGNS